MIAISLSRNVYDITYNDTKPKLGVKNVLRQKYLSFSTIQDIIRTILSPL